MEYLDPIRVITNLSSGKMGLAMINEAIRHGGQITHIVGNTNTLNHSGIFSHSKNNLQTIRVNTSDEMYSKVVSELSSKKYDIVIFAAAVTDFKPMEMQNKKISSQVSDSITFKFIPTKKIINELKLIDKDLFLVGFKAYYDVSDSYLINRAKEKLKECSADIIVANDVGRKNTNIGSDYNEVFIVARNNDGNNADNNQVIHLKVQSKESIAEKLFEVILSKMK
jgi:phosphopantothenoylcysteine decarboxylase/phosphopantothenate--cysteine ligase